MAKQLEAEFAKLVSAEWTLYKHYNQDKAGLAKRGLMPETLGRLVDEFNSDPFVAWLSRLTGIPNLMADPDLEGGGLHQSQRGGHLNIHADFTVHFHHPTWHRRVNLLLYLNDNWKEEWKGAIELWDRNMTRCVAKVQPILNHALIFNTNDSAYHGFPHALQCPEGESRKSVAVYYYTISDAAAHATAWKSRPEDTKGKAAMIWADRQVTTAYSKIKSKLGLSDDFVSRVLAFMLAFFSKKKP